jgi:hypothetical protein
MLLMWHGKRLRMTCRPVTPIALSLPRRYVGDATSESGAGLATTAQAIERIAKETGIIHANVFRTARALREHDTRLWPQGSQGKGQAAHVEAEHLVNLMLALAMAETTTEAPEVVARFWEMVAAPDQTVTQRHEFEEGAWGVVATPRPMSKLPEALAGRRFILGEILTYFVQWTATIPEAREQFRREKLEVMLLAGPFESASVTRRDGNTSVRENYSGGGLLHGLPLPTPPAAMLRTVILPFALFEVLADLYADTLSRKQSGLPLPPSDPVHTTTGDEETENAGPTTGPALIRNQDRNSSDPAPSEGQPEANGEREQSQAPSRGPGRSHNRHRRRRDERAANSPAPAAA